MKSRVLVADPDRDVRSLLQALLTQLGYEPVLAEPLGPVPLVDAVLLEPGSAEERALLERFDCDGRPPVVCLSIYPREAGYEPTGSVVYLQKPTTRAQLAEALQAALH